MRTRERAISSVPMMILRVIYGIVIIAIQIYIYYLLFFMSLKIPHILTFINIIGLILAIFVYRSNRNISYKLSWIIIILLFNFAGVMAYIAFGHGDSIPRRKNRELRKYYGQIVINNNVLDEIKEVDMNAYKIANLIVNDINFPIFKNTQVVFLNDGKEKYKFLIRDLKEAKEYIFLEYFIVADGVIWEEIKNILIAKAKEGVIIKMIYDDVGSKPVLNVWKIKQLNQINNIEIVAYNPLGVNLSISLNYRDHRKIVIIDGKVAYNGGINLADEYFHIKDRFGFWRDNAIRLSGDAVDSYLRLFCQMWYMSTKQMLDISSFRRYSSIKSNGYVLPFGDGPGSRKYTSYTLFKQLINQADKYLYISTPYFIIDSEFIQQIITACKSGIDVKILIPYIPDKKMIYLVTLAHLGKIIKAGGKVYAYKPGFNHAKTVISDDKYAFIGTVNVDYRSMFLHFECGNFLYNNDCIKDMKEDFLKAVNESEIISYERWEKRAISTKVLDFILTVLAPLM